MLEVLHKAAAGPLERDGEDALTVCESFGVLQGAVPKERVDRGKAHIAGGDAVVPVEFQVLKERGGRLGAEVVQVELDDGPPRLGRDEAQQEHEAVPIAADGDSSPAPGAGGRRRTPGGLARGRSARRRSSRTSRAGGSRDEVAAVVGESRAGGGRRCQRSGVSAPAGSRGRSRVSIRCSISRAVSADSGTRRDLWNLDSRIASVRCGGS